MKYNLLDYNDRKHLQIAQTSLQFRAKVQAEIWFKFCIKIF